MEKILYKHKGESLNYVKADASISFRPLTSSCAKALVLDRLWIERSHSSPWQRAALSLANMDRKVLGPGRRKPYTSSFD